MRHLIKRSFPTHGIVGEEFGSEREDAEYVWVLDPIDGTRAFIAGLPTWGTLIGLSHRGQPSKDLKRRGFTFVGPTTMHALMEATGLVDTHLVGCHRRGAGRTAPAR